MCVCVCVCVCVADYYPYRPEEAQGDDGDGVFSDDEASVQRGLRRSQSVKMTRAKAARKEVCVWEGVCVYLPVFL